MTSMIALMHAIEGAATDPATISRARVLRSQFEIRAWLNDYLNELSRRSA